jgi:hypothetical protein
MSAFVVRTPDKSAWGCLTAAGQHCYLLIFSQLHKKAVLSGLVDESGWFSQMLVSRKTTVEYTLLTKILLSALVSSWLKKSVLTCVHLWQENSLRNQRNLS